MCVVKGQGMSRVVELFDQQSPANGHNHKLPTPEMAYFGFLEVKIISKNSLQVFFERECMVAQCQFQ